MIYIIKSYGKDNTQLIKLGYSNNIESRLKSYVDANPFVDILYKIEFVNSKIFEKQFHTKYKLVSVHKNEWYDISMYDTMLHEVGDFILNNTNEPEINENKAQKSYFIFINDMTVFSLNYAAEIIGVTKLKFKSYVNRNMKDKNSIQFKMNDYNIMVNLQTKGPVPRPPGSKRQYTRKLK